MDQLEPRAQLRASTDPGDGRLVVELAGEFDIAGLEAVEPQLDELLGRDPQPLVVDLGGVQFLDSSGIAALIRIANRFTPVEVRRPSPQVRRVFAVLGLAGRFGVGDG